MRYPEFIIIGAQKSATTYLGECIREHPDIWMPDTEIPAFESPDYEQGALDDLSVEFGNRSEKILGIKRASYLFHKEVRRRIARHIPRARLIVILRNPVQRMISAYFHYMQTGFLPVLPIETGLSMIINGKLQAAWKRSSEIISFSIYSDKLEEYRKNFSDQQLKIFFFDDVISNPGQYIGEIYAFLGVDDKFIPHALSSRPQKVHYSLTRIKILSRKNSYLYDYNDEKTRLFPKKNISFFSRSICNFINGLDHITGMITSNDKPVLSNNLLHKLSEILVPDINKLELLVNRDLSSWKQSFHN